LLIDLMVFKASVIRQQGEHFTSAMIGNPGLLQEGPDVSPLRLRIARRASAQWNSVLVPEGGLADWREVRPIHSR
jgi:hypothetical protein